MKKTQSNKNEIIEVLLSFKRTFFTIFAFSAIINLMMIAPSLYMLQVYDRVLASRNEVTLLMLTILIIGAYLLTSGLELMRSLVLIRVGAKFDMALNHRVYSAAFQQNLKHSGTNAGQALADLTGVRQFLTGGALFAFFDFPWFPIYLVIIFFFQLELGLFAVAGATILVALAIANEYITKGPLDEANSLAVRASQLATNNLRNAEVVEAMGMLPNLVERWFKLHGRFLTLQANASHKASVIASTTKFVQTAMQSLVLGLGALLVIENKLSPGMMIAASMLLGRTLQPVQQVISVWKSVGAVRSSYRRLRDLLERNPVRGATMSLPAPLGALSVNAISAAPPGTNVSVIKGVTFALSPGEVLGVLGPSGCGKSALARLLVGVWTPLSGKVRLDGVDISQWNKLELGPYIGYLPQDIKMFSGSVSENIARFGAVDATKVVEASTRAGVHEMILLLPQGYDTKLEDDGEGLSGGQKQRIGLARAMYNDPTILVLDEPNSNLDEVGEQALLKAISDLRQRGKTIVVVTHRPSVLTVTTKLLVLREGTVQMFGPTAQVIAAVHQSNKKSAGVHIGSQAVLTSRSEPENAHK